MDTGRSVSVETEIQLEGKQRKHSQPTPFAEELLPFKINIKANLENSERLLLSMKHSISVPCDCLYKSAKKLFGFDGNIIILFFLM